jgi:adenylate cyclase
LTDNPERASQTVSRLRLATGLVLFSFLVTHFVNHALGLVSLDAMEQGRRLFLALWRNPAGTAALYGAILIHFGLALWSVYRRRTLRMAGWEAAQLLLGLLIPPLLFAHVVGTRVSHEIAGTEGSYAWVLYVLWELDPVNAVRQTAVFSVAWIHGCIGLHFWLRFKPHYRAYMPFTYAGALLVPTFGLLGFVQSAQTIAEFARDPAWVASLVARVGSPGQAEAAVLADIKTGLTAGFWLLLAGTLLARVIRDAIHRRRAVTITYPLGRRIAVRPGTSLLEASRMLHIPQAAVCGGRGRCSTCRTQIAQGLDLLPPPNQQERAVLERIGAPPNVRLACQTEPSSDVSAIPLLSPAEGMRAARRQGAAHGHEREVAVMFTDLRSFTRISEHRLPYDVVFLLNRYFDAMGGAIESVDGHIDKFIGDGVMAVFGIRRPIDEACRRALAAAGAMSKNLQQLNDSLGLEGIEPLRIGIGLHAGPAIVGEMGYGRATSVTAIGDTVNTANRLEALTKDYDCQFVVSETVLRHAGIASPKCDSHTVVVRGRREPLTVHAIGDAREVSMMEGADGI